MCVFVCVCHTHTFASLGSSNIGLFCEAYIEPMSSGCRSDVLKVFLGSLHPTVIKPHIVSFLSDWGLTPCDVIVPACRAPAAIAFAVFENAEQAAAAVEACHGLVDEAVSPGAIQAHTGANMGVFSSC